MLKKIVDPVARIIVGGLFIFSGLIKLNDPVGTKIKLEEYFDIFSTDFASFFSIFVPWALEIGLFLIILEVVLGVAILINFRMKLATSVMLALMVFFTALTFYSAYTGKVTDCGCFGDAIPLTPWQSFYKDVFLMVFVLHLFWYRKSYEPALPSKLSKGIVLGTTVLSFILGYIAIAHLPFIDFRPYEVGNSIPQEMIAKEAPILEYTFEKDGETMTSLKYLMPEDGYTYVSSEVVNEKESTPAITDYQVIGRDGNDYTEQTFTGKKLLLIFHDITHADTDDLEQVSGVVNELAEIETMILTSAGEAEFEALRHEYQLAAPFYFVDATVLKAMIRSNPGLILVNEGTVLGKWHNNDTPAIETLQELAN